jgi:hypothetical protein
MSLGAQVLAPWQASAPAESRLALRFRCIMD